MESIFNRRWTQINSRGYRINQSNPVNKWENRTCKSLVTAVSLHILMKASSSTRFLLILKIKMNNSLRILQTYLVNKNITLKSLVSLNKSSTNNKNSSIGKLRKLHRILIWIGKKILSKHKKGISTWRHILRKA